MAKLTIAQRNRAVGMLQTGMSSVAVTRALNTCHSTILRVWTLFQQKAMFRGDQKTGRRGSRPLHNTSKSSYEFVDVQYERILTPFLVGGGGG